MFQLSHFVARGLSKYKLIKYNAHNKQKLRLPSESVSRCKFNETVFMFTLAQKKSLEYSARNSRDFHFRQQLDKTNK